MGSWGEGLVRGACAGMLLLTGCGPEAEGSQTVEATGDRSQITARVTGPEHISGAPSMTDPLVFDIALTVSGPAGGVVRTVGQGRPGNGCQFHEPFSPNLTIGADGTATDTAVGSHGRDTGCTYEITLHLYADGRDPDTSEGGPDSVARTELVVPVD